MTREEWLRHAVERLDADVFNGDLELLEHDYQISYGRCPGKNMTEVIQPSDSEDIGLDDFFPTTISVNYTINDPIKILGELAFACMVAFFNMKPKGKIFKVTAEKYYFEKLDTWQPSSMLKDILKQSYERLKKDYGDFPGKAVKFPVKEKKETKKNSYAVFCPECGYEMKVARKIFEKHNGGLPTCPCGAKMGIDMENEEDEEKEK